MHFTAAVVTALASVLALSTASPLETRQTTTTPPPARYYLHTKVVNGNHKDTGSNKTNLWVYSYHTGAGLGDAALSSNKSVAWEGYLNGTQQLFTYKNNQAGPWPLSIGFSSSYQEWNTASISIAGISTLDVGFFFNSTGLQYNGSTGGWLACDWWYGVPQLFQIYGYLPTTVPNSCSKVQLLPVAV